MSEIFGDSVIASPRFVHLAHDNVFLVSFSSYIEEIAPGRSDYVVVCTGQELRYPPQAQAVVLASSEQEAREHVLANAANYDVLIVHSMVGAWAQIVPEVGQQLLTLWSGFGGDYYGSDCSPDAGILGPKTARLRRQLAPKLTLGQRFDKHWFQLSYGLASRRAAKNANFFSAPVPTDYDVFRARFPAFRGEYIQLNYATAEENSPATTIPIGNNLLIGNSATYANNHLEVFDMLAAVGWEGRKLIVPLSYGYPDGYRDAVVNAGAKHFGSDFEPLLELLPMEEYNSLISSCSHAIMGHQRQQAVGNIITALMGGTALVLDQRNPVFSFLRQQGIHLTSLQELSETGLIGAELSAAERSDNINVAISVWGRETVLNNMKHLVRRTQEMSAT